MTNEYGGQVGGEHNPTEGLFLNGFDGPITAADLAQYEQEAQEAQDAARGRLPEITDPEEAKAMFSVLRRVAQARPGIHASAILGEAMGDLRTAYPDALTEEFVRGLDQVPPTTDTESTQD
jgi:hypothetical protein